MLFDGFDDRERPVALIDSGLRRAACQRDMPAESRGVFPAVAASVCHRHRLFLGSANFSSHIRRIASVLDGTLGCAARHLSSFSRNSILTRV
jgi:hypothetical protein